MQIVADQLVNRLVRVRDPTLDLRLGNAVHDERKRRRRIITRLRLHAGEVHRITMHTRRRAGLEPAQFESELTQRDREPFRRRLSDPSACRLPISAVHEPAQKRTRRDHHRSAGEFAPIGQSNARYPLTARSGLDGNHVDHPLHKFEIRGRFEPAPDLGCIEMTIGLRARRPDRRPLAPIQHAKLNSRRIDDLPHQPAQGIDLADHLPLAQAADGRIA